MPQVFGYLLPRCGSVAIAEDLTADTFLAAVAAAGSPDPPHVTVAWLIGVSRHKLVDHWRRVRREQRTLTAIDEAGVDDPWDAELDSVDAHAALAQLPPTQRAALSLRYLDGLPVAPRPEFAAALLRRIAGRPDTGAEPATVRYFVDDLEAAVSFYTQLLEFETELRPSSVFAMLYRGELRLLLSVPGGAHTLSDGTLPAPGGSNRISLRVTDLDATVSSLRAGGARFQTGITSGIGVDLAVLEDPSGNPIELFEPSSPRRGWTTAEDDLQPHGGHPAVRTGNHQNT